jgi:hypothetical protein
MKSAEPPPARFVVTIGGFGGPHYEVRLRRGRLWYRTDDLQAKVAPSVQEWAVFWTALDRIGVWGWRSRYNNADILDGTQWSVEITNGTLSVKCTGSNLYPCGQDQEYGLPFQQFLDAISTLVGQPFGN